MTYLLQKNSVGTPDAKYSTVSFPVYTSPSVFPDFLAVEHALKIKVAKLLILYFLNSY